MIARPLSQFLSWVDDLVSSGRNPMLPAFEANPNLAKVVRGCDIMRAVLPGHAEQHYESAALQLLRAWGIDKLCG